MLSRYIKAHGLTRIMLKNALQLLTHPIPQLPIRKPTAGERQDLEELQEAKIDPRLNILALPAPDGAEKSRFLYKQSRSVFAANRSTDLTICF